MQNLYNFNGKLNSKISEFIIFGRFKIKATNSIIFQNSLKFKISR